MVSRLIAILRAVRSSLKSRRRLALENLALRQQLAMLQHSVKRPGNSNVDRLFWVLFSKYIGGWRALLHMLDPDTVMRWHREGFRRYGRWKSRRRRMGRRAIELNVHKLIRQMHEWCHTRFWLTW